jgi:hypothetical protein
MANDDRRHTSDRRKTHTFGIIMHCSNTVCQCSTDVLSLFSTVGHSSIRKKSETSSQTPVAAKGWGFPAPEFVLPCLLLWRGYSLLVQSFGGPST